MSSTDMTRTGATTANGAATAGAVAGVTWTDRTPADVMTTDVAAAGATKADGAATGAASGAEMSSAPVLKAATTADVAAADAAAVDVASIIDELGRRQLTVACAESLTGGLLAAAFVEVPGASAVFRGGAICYATQTKASVLGVDAGLLARRGPVDSQVAADMAESVRRLYGADIGLSTTGVAGPGPADGQEAGTVWVAVAGELGQAPRLLHVDGSRAQVRAGAVTGALELLIAALDAAV